SPTGPWAPAACSSTRYTLAGSVTSAPMAGIVATEQMTGHRRDPVMTAHLPGGNAARPGRPPGHLSKGDFREHRAARDPRRDPATVGLPGRQRCRGATAPAPRGGIGA